MTNVQLHRLGAGALLLAAHHAEKAMREAASRHVAEAAAEVERQRNMKRAAIVLLLLSTGKRMVDSLASAIVSGRSEARRISAKRMAAELSASGADVENTVRPLLVTASMARAHEDAAHAQVAAESLASQWRGLARHSIAAAERKGDHPYRGISRSGDLLLPRIKRTAVTETAHAYNDEHREAARDAERYGLLDGDVLLREWSALLDRRTCPECSALHGAHAPLHGSFPGRNEPGNMHPNCRCIEVMVAVPVSKREAA